MEFDVNTWRSAITVVSLFLFLALMARVLGRRHRGDYAEAAQLPFAPEADLVTTPKGTQHE
jgi:cbb3-type cytochrome oxidase subunit 3